MSLVRAVQRTTGSGGGGAEAINDLTDVTITSAANKDFLRFNGTTWVNETEASVARSLMLAYADTIIPESPSQSQREGSTEKGKGSRKRMTLMTTRKINAMMRRRRFVTCEPTERPVEVKMSEVIAKKKAVASAAISPTNFMKCIS